MSYQKKTDNPNMGRPKDELKHKFKRILEESNAYEKFKQILIKAKKEDVFLKAFDMCHDRAFGKAQQFVDMDVNDVTGRPTKEELNDALRSLNGHSTGNGVDQGT